ncbi:MAG: 4-hydroxy-3-methylbut-2-enyl diphosphate reductase [Ruminococcaceae bacterium]|nr:4-hydroxy-3-methylbut-2-enyl diphosphate reductase [Oscillospiraceae bacterium]
MGIFLAKTAGFCFGVNRAVEMVDSLLNEGKKVYTLGPIIHNSAVVSDFERRGASIADKPSDVTGDGVLVIRSHGVAESVYNEISELSLSFCDATCPFVAKIHNIVSEASARGEVVLIAGDARHPEVLGISGHCKGEYFVFSNDTELAELTKDNPGLAQKSVTVVAQTTFNSELWKICSEKIKKVYTNATIFDTICNATLQRQREAVELSRKCDLMVVIGGRHSSNTQKLGHICSENCRTLLVESASEIDPAAVRAAHNIGITAGASTPAGIIKEVLSSMTEIINSDENFEAMLEESLRTSNTNGKVVKGIVVSIAPNEIYVDVGRKQSGVVLLEELTDNPNLSTEDCVKIGDELELMILRTNDQEGYIYLSKRVLDSVRAWDEIKAAAPKISDRPRRRRDDDDEDVFHADDEQTEAKAEEAAPVEETPAQPEEKKEPVIFEGVVTEVIKGGVIVSYKGVKVFVPASQATATRNEPLEGLLKKTVKFIVIEVNPSRRRAVGSIRALLNKERKEKEAKFWEEIAEGAVFTGTVKSLTTYGAFVDLGAVDGMVHISELSWNRIKHPSEVVNVGDVVEVFVKKVDKEKRKISLGYKKTEDNPWEIMKNKYPVGTVIEAPVVGTPTFGAFVNILPGIDGLVHISQLSNTRVEAPTDVVKVGDVVRAVITEVDLERKRVSLSMRKLLEDSEPVEEEIEEGADEE